MVQATILRPEQCPNSGTIWLCNPEKVTSFFSSVVQSPERSPVTLFLPQVSAQLIFSLCSCLSVQSHFPSTDTSISIIPSQIWLFFITPLIDSIIHAYVLTYVPSLLKNGNSMSAGLYFLYYLLPAPRAVPGTK